MKRIIPGWIMMIALAVGLTQAAAAQTTSKDAEYYDEPGVRLLNQPLAEYQARRKRLLEKYQDGVVVVLGAIEDDEATVRYRQNNWMAYFTGVRTPNAAMLLVPQGLPSLQGAKEIVFIPPRNSRAERWTGVQLGPGPEAARTFGVERVLSTEELWPRLKEAAALPPFKSDNGKTKMKLYTVVPLGAVAATLRESEFVERARNDIPGLQIVEEPPTSLLYVAGEMRKIKSTVELGLLQRAIDITGEAHAEIAKNLRPGMFEYQIQAVLESVFMRGGAERPGFPSIVGSGVYATILHYTENRKRIEDGDLVVCDIGAEYSLYTADITRTFPANGRFTPRQRAIYQLVLDTQAAAAAGWKPGMNQFQLHQIAVSFMRQSPLRAKGTDGREYTMDHFFIHGLGHFLGMDVHDVGDYDVPLKPGEVFTIEPGIYIASENLGVRIEDDFTITPELKIHKLSARIPSSPDAIEGLMNAARR